MRRSRAECEALREQIKQCIMERDKDATIASIARQCGCCESTVSGVAKSLGVSFRHYELHRSNLTQAEKTAIIRERWMAGVPTREIADEIGIADTNVSARAKRMGLPPRDALVRRLQSEAAKEMNARCTNRFGKSVATRRALIKMERFRMLHGLPRQTKLILSDVPKKVRYAMGALVVKYHYFRDRRYPYTLFYDSETERLSETPLRIKCHNDMHCEQYYVERYGITFMKADEDRDGGN